MSTAHDAERALTNDEEEYWDERAARLPEATRLVFCTHCGLQVRIPDPQAYDLDEWYLLSYPFVALVHTRDRYDFYCFRLRCQEAFRAEVAQFNRHAHLLRAKSPTHSTMEDRRSMVDWTSPTDTDLEQGVRHALDQRRERAEHAAGDVSPRD